MLRVIIEFIHGGFGEPTEIGRMEIWNDGEGTPTSGNYGFRIFAKRLKRVIKSGHISRFKRKTWSVWYLLYLCLNEIYGK